MAQMAFTNDRMTFHSSKGKMVDVAMREFVDTLNHFYGSSHNTNTEGVKRNFIEWNMNKLGLFNLLSSHPGWNPETLSVESVFTRLKTYDRGTTVRLLDNYMYTLNIDRELRDNFKSQMFRLKFLNQPIIGKGTIELYDKRVEAGTLHEWLALQKPVAGQKVTRYLRAVLVKAGMSVEQGSQKIPFLRLCESFTEAEKKYRFFMSIHPSDYLTMSNGRSWDSCHSLDGGCYKRGTLSYMNDESTVITYILDDETETGGAPAIIANIPKIYRSAVMIGEDGTAMMRSRTYPHDDNNAFAEYYTNKVMDILKEISVARGKERDYCNSTGGTPNIRQFFNVLDNGHYPDYNYMSVPFYHQSGIESAPRKSIGGINYCLGCGEEFHTDASGDDVECYSCQGSYVGDCYICGGGVHDRYQHNVSGRLLCDDCFECETYRCHSCYQDFISNDAPAVNIRGLLNCPTCAEKNKQST